MSDLDEAVFGGNTTLWNVLDTENVSNLNVEFTRLEEQVVTLGRTVDNNYNIQNDRLTVLNTQVNNLNSEVDTLSSEINGLGFEVTALELQTNNLQQQVDEIDVSGLQMQVNTLTLQVTQLNDTVENLTQNFDQRLDGVESSVATLNTTVTGLNSQVVSLSNTVSTLNSRVNNLEANQQRFTVITSGNTYNWNFRVNTQNYRRTITFTSPNNIPITANVSRPATILDTQSGTQYSTNVKLCAPFDTFRTNGTLAYDMMLGGCYMQRTGDTNEGPLGYMAPI